LNLKPPDENSENYFKWLSFIFWKHSINNQGSESSDATAMAKVAAETEPLQKPECFLKKIIFTSQKTSKHVDLYFLIPALLVFLSPVQEWLDAGQTGIPAVSIAVVSIAVVSILVVSISVVIIAVPVVSIAVVSIMVVGIALVSIAVVSIAVVSIAVVSIAVVSIAVASIAVVSIAAVSIVEPHHVMRLQCSNLQLSCGFSRTGMSCCSSPAFW
jgi:hypothetical protein